MHSLTEVLHALKEALEEACIRYRGIRIKMHTLTEAGRACPCASRYLALFFFSSSNACVLENHQIIYLCIYLYLYLSVCLSVCLSTCVMYVFI